MSNEARSDPVEIVNAVLEAWNARDLDALVALLTEDVEWYDPAMPSPPARGRDAVKAFAASILRAFPDFRYEIDLPMCVSEDRRRCAIRWRISGTHLQPLDPPGYAPTNRMAVFEGVDVLDIREHKIGRILTAFDVVPAVEQLLGLRLRPVPGSWRCRAVVLVQRCLAWFARRNGSIP